MSFCASFQGKESFDIPFWKRISILSECQASFMRLAWYINEIIVDLDKKPLSNSCVERKRFNERAQISHGYKDGKERISAAERFLSVDLALFFFDVAEVLLHFVWISSKENSIARKITSIAIENAGSRSKPSFEEDRFRIWSKFEENQQEFQSQAVISKH